ncbi:hypothetical protein [Phenylobacterium soli]|nr:hypothetical protein [Phenylobacterium soli]
MSREQTKNSVDASAGYAALRHGGAPPWRAAAELAVEARRAKKLEGLFQRRKAGGPDPMKPAYANNGRHVADVLREGGFPVLKERGR